MVSNRLYVFTKSLDIGRSNRQRNQLRLCHLALEHRLHLLVAYLLVALLEAERLLMRDPGGADVAGHDQNGVLEIDTASQAIG